MAIGMIYQTKLTIFQAKKYKEILVHGVHNQDLIMYKFLYNI